MHPKSLRFLLVAAALPVLFFHVYLVGPLLWKIGNDPILSLAIAGAFVMHCWRGRGRREMAVTVALAVLLRVAYEQVIGISSRYFGQSIVSWGSFLGIASILVLGWRSLREKGDAGREATSDLFAAAGFFMFWIVFDIGLAVTTISLPRTYDANLYGFDRSLGAQVGFWCGRLLPGRPVLSGITHLVYGGIALPIAMLYASQRCRGYAHGYKVFPLLIAAATGGYAVYYIIPATGPVFAFPGVFPLGMPPVDLGMREVVDAAHRAARNALPSLHLGAALILYWNSREWPRAARAALLVFLGATAFSTLALGEHYIVDLVVAFPAMLTFHAAATTVLPLRERERYIPMVAGLAATVAWVCLLRFGSGLYLHWPAAVSWFLAAATVGGASLLETWLARRVGRFTQPPWLQESDAEPAILAGAASR